MGVAVKERKQNMLLTKEEVKLIERLRQLRRQSENHFVIVKPDFDLCWWVADRKES